mgnify:CR=1 FL=1
MNKYKVLGITLLVIFAMLVLGEILSGTYLHFGGKSVGYYLGYFTARVALLVAGVLFFRKGSKN